MNHSKPAKQEISYKEIYKTLDKQIDQYENFQADVKLSFTDNGKKLGGTGDLRVRRGEEIFIRVKKFGFEVGRAWITRDKIVLKNTFQREYIEEDLDIVKQEFGMEPNFDLLEEILLGTPSLEYRKKDKTKLIGDGYKIQGQSPFMDVQVEAQVLSKLLQVISARYSTPNNDAVDVTYSEELTKLGMPVERTFMSKPEDDIFEVTYKIKSIKEGAGTIPEIQIPSSYKKTEI